MVGPGSKPNAGKWEAAAATTSSPLRVGASSRPNSARCRAQTPVRSSPGPAPSGAGFASIAP